MHCLHFHCNINIKNMFNYTTCIQVNCMYACIFGKFRFDTGFPYKEVLTIVFV